MEPRIELLIYVIGAAIYGLIYQPLKSALGSGIPFIAGTIAYLVLLNMACHVAGRYLESRRHE